MSTHGEDAMKIEGRKRTTLWGLAIGLLGLFGLQGARHMREDRT
jgi:hypothetical protein